MANYVTHTCKTCGKAFVAADRNNAKNKPPRSKNCPQCLSEGKVNIADPVKVLRMKSIRPLAQVG